MTPEQIKNFAEIGSAAVPILAALATGYWFLFTRSFRQRVEFDCALRIFDVGEDRPYLAELVVIVENKGQREHRLYNLWAEVRQPTQLSSPEGQECYLPQTNLVPKPMEYFFVSPGVRQTFPVTFEIRRDVRIVEAIALFVHQETRVDFTKERVTLKRLDALNLTPHSTVKLFAVAPTDDPSPAADAN